ncbi:MAG: repressor LexA [Deltaproteobacteria bacterium]|nr:repressor LexA [Deltaproteobacteria bacterium]
MLQAGALTEAIEQPEGYLTQRPRGRGETELFALRVRGESMRDAGIFPGDLAIVRRQPTAESGQIVVAMVDGEATIKRLRFRGKRAELHPANPEFDVIHPDAKALQILGRVVEIRRYYDLAPIENSEN